MKTKFTMFRRGAMFYMQDSATGKQTSLRTKDEAEASSLLNARNAAQQQPTLNLHLARAYLTASDPAFVERTWQTVMEQLQSRGKGSSRERYASVFKSPSFDGLRNKKLLETTTDDFFAVFKDGKVSIVYFLKRLHNFALSLGWIAIPIVAPYLWPKGVEDKYRIIIEPHDGHWVYQSEVQGKDEIWSSLIWGGRRDIRLIRNCSSGASLSELQAKQHVFIREGFIRGDRKKEQKALEKRRILEADGFPSGTFLHLHANVLETTNDLMVHI